MPLLTFRLANGSATSIEARIGETVMAVATSSGVPGIEALCGGFCSCATCHVYVDEEWLAKLPAPAPEENEMLNGTAAQRHPNSRLSCQITLTKDLDGLIVTLPAHQT